MNALRTTFTLACLLMSPALLISAPVVTKQPGTPEKPSDRPPPQDPEHDWKKSGFTLLSYKRGGKQRIIALADAKGRRLRITTHKVISPAMLARILRQKKIYHSWSFVKVNRIDFLVAGGIIDTHVVPDKVTCFARDYTAYVPAGILLSEADTLEYNFRITIKNVFIRIKGLYSSERAICTKLRAALDNPRDYARKRDPEYILRKLEELETRLQRLLLAQQRLQHAVISLHNKGFFSGPTPPKKKVVARIVELRTKEPNLGVEKIVARMQKQGVKVTAQEVHLILNVFFNVYKK